MNSMPYNSQFKEIKGQTFYRLKLSPLQLKILHFFTSKLS